MGQEVTRIEADGLSEQQRKFVEAIMAGQSEEDAKRLAGYADTTPTVGILRGKLVENAISAFVDSEMKGRMKLKALKTLDKLMDGNSAQVALGAARIVLELAEAAEEGEDKPLSELTTEELEAMTARLELERELRMKDVTPGKGA